jgi:hypothetical protein
MGTIVCGVDRSPGARTAVQSAVHLGPGLAAELLETGPIPVVVVPPELQSSRAWTPTTKDDRHEHRATVRS